VDENKRGFLNTNVFPRNVVQLLLPNYLAPTYCRGVLKHAREPPSRARREVNTPRHPTRTPHQHGRGVFFITEGNTIMAGWLDRLNPALRHTILVASGILITAVLQYVQTTYTTWNLPAELVAIIGLIIPMALTTLTSITQQYGVGSNMPTDPAALGPKS